MKVLKLVVIVVFAITSPAIAVTKSKVATTKQQLKFTVVAGVPFMEIPSRGSSKVSVTVCPEESEPTVFAVSYNTPMKGLTVALTCDLQGQGNTKISRNNVDVFRLSCDDLIAASDSRMSCPHTHVDIGPEPISIWLTVNVPRGTKAGLYKSAVGFYQGKKLVFSTPIEVNVFPLRLLGSSKQYALFTNYGPGCLDGEVGISYAQFLAAFKKLGIKVVGLSCSPSEAAQAFRDYTAAGMGGPLPVLCYAFDKSVPTDADVKAIDDARKAAGVPAAIYVCFDDPRTVDDIELTIAQINAMHAAKVRAISRVTDPDVLGSLSDIDGVNYHVDAPYVRSLISGEKKRNSSKWEWYWWDARESASKNRIYAGLALWKSGLDGCFPVWMPIKGKSPLDGVRSLLGEALREGIDDTRYITTYMKALRELKDMKRQKDKDYIAFTEDYLSKFLARPVEQLTPIDLAQLKAKMAEFSLKLASML